MSQAIMLSPDSGIERAMFEIEIHPTKVIEINPVSFYILRERADWDAKRLSMMFPEGCVKLLTMARCKAVYKNGERTKIFDYNDFYSNLTAEELESTKILCSNVHKYV
jgi:hypothetical protein